LPDRPVELHDRKIAVPAGIEHIVAEHSRNLQPAQAQRCRDLRCLPGRGFRVGRAHIGDDLDALGGA
jgi:hypothetical protein